jgi:hypothetical protein
VAHDCAEAVAEEQLVHVASGDCVSIEVHHPLVLRQVEDEQLGVDAIEASREALQQDR